MANRMAELEKAHRGKLMRVVDLPDEYHLLKSWVGDMKFGRDNVMAVIGDHYVWVKWYTHDSVISVAVKLPKTESETDRGYLGGFAQKRAPRPGETWTRGNDLADGIYAHETWNQILADAAGWSAQPLDAIFPKTPPKGK